MPVAAAEGLDRAELAVPGCDSRVSAQLLSTSARVRRLLLTLPPGSLDEEQAVRDLIANRRSLCRRLAAEGSGVPAIRHRVRVDLDPRHLANPRPGVAAQ